jgi:hypothetical protein
MNATPPPGWYPDNIGSGQRYWDGQKWTEHTAPAGSQPTASPSTLRAAPLLGAAVPSSGSWFLRHKVLSGVLAFILFLFVVGAIGSAGDDPTPAAAETSTKTASEPTEEVAPATEPVTEPEPVDTDQDGAIDEDDLRPQDPQIQTRDDLDTDRDGTRDGDDVQPKDPKVQTRDDIDSDRDGVADYKDDFPKDARYSLDTDDDGVANQLDSFPNDGRYSHDTDGDHVADSEDAFPSDPSRSKITLAMQNALGAAQDYLDYTAFSRMGLIDQLSSQYGDGFGVEDATWAVSQSDVDWRLQAVKSAKDYLDYSSFSRQGLIDQLSSAYGDQYTVEEAIYAVNKLGL